MSSPIATVVMAAMLASVSGSRVENQNGFTAEQRQIIVDKHNEYRLMEDATDMQTMTYDLGLEASAQAAADGCNFAHSAGISPPVGENIAAGTSSSFVTDSFVTSWWSERPDYYYDTNTCRTAPGENIMCGHYTQVVWATTTKVGCGVSFCDAMTGWGNPRKAWIVFCQYSKAGNWRGQKPYTCSKASCGASPSGGSEPAPPAAIDVVMPDAYCKANNPTSSMCSFPSCAWTYCQDGASCMGTPSPDGIPCDVGKVCISGSCQDDPTDKTNTLTAGCLFGDHPQMRNFCTQYKSYGFLCQNYGSTYCCGTCSTKK